MTHDDRDGGEVLPFAPRPRVAPPAFLNGPASIPGPATPEPAAPTEAAPEMPRVPGAGPMEPPIHLSMPGLSMPGMTLPEGEDTEDGAFTGPHPDPEASSTSEAAGTALALVTALGVAAAQGMWHRARHRKGLADTARANADKKKAAASSASGGTSTTKTTKTSGSSGGGSKGGSLLGGLGGSGARRKSAGSGSSGAAGKAPKTGTLKSLLGGGGKGPGGSTSPSGSKSPKGSKVSWRDRGKVKDAKGSSGSKAGGGKTAGGKKSGSGSGKSGSAGTDSSGSGSATGRGRARRGRARLRRAGRLAASKAASGARAGAQDWKTGVDGGARVLADKAAKRLPKRKPAETTDTAKPTPTDPAKATEKPDPTKPTGPEATKPTDPSETGEKPDPTKPPESEATRPEATRPEATETGERPAPTEATGSDSPKAAEKPDPQSAAEQPQQPGPAEAAEEQHGPDLDDANDPGSWDKEIWEAWDRAQRESDERADREAKERADREEDRGRARTWERLAWERAERVAQERERDAAAPPPPPDWEWMRPPPAADTSTRYWAEDARETKQPGPAADKVRPALPAGAAEPNAGTKGETVTVVTKQNTQYNDADLTIGDVIEADGDMAVQITEGVAETLATAEGCDRLFTKLEELHARIVDLRVPGILEGAVVLLMDKTATVKSRAQAIAEKLPLAAEAISTAGSNAEARHKPLADAVADAGHTRPAERQYHQE